MGKPRQFTTQAREDISQLKEKSTRSAVAVASIYLQKRLRTLVTRGLGIDTKLGRKKFKAMFTRQSLATLKSLALEAEMVTPDESELLGKFVELRNGVVHGLELWDPLTSEERRVMRSWCDFVVHFMEETDYRTEKVQESKAQTHTSKKARGPDVPDWRSPRVITKLDGYIGQRVPD